MDDDMVSKIVRMPTTITLIPNSKSLKKTEDFECHYRIIPKRNRGGLCVWGCVCVGEVWGVVFVQFCSERIPNKKKIV